MSTGIDRLGLSGSILVLAALGASPLWGSAFVGGDYYRLGEADPGAAPGNLGNALTVDLGFWGLDLARSGRPWYSADTSPRAVGSKLSMRFDNAPGLLDMLSVPSYYSRSSPLTQLESAFGLETWAKTTSPLPVDSSGYAVIAALGDPFAGGLGILQHDGNYVVRAGSMEKVLGPASLDQWMHLAYVRTFDAEEFFVNGIALGSAEAKTPPPASGALFMLGGNAADGSQLFDGLIDETRFFSYNPLAMGAEGPGPLLISPVPEPAGLLLLAGILGLLGRRRRHR